MQGTVKQIYDEMFKKWPGVKVWLDLIHIKQNNYHNGTFVGNDCMPILRNKDKLQQIASLNILKCVQILRCLYQVVISCFGMSLDSEYETYINKFKDVYMDLGISITPKVYILTDHVIVFFKKHGHLLGW